MKIILFLPLIISLLLALGCEKTSNDSLNDSIVYRSVNKEYVLIRDVQTLQQSDDAISNHVDSILSGLTNEVFISTGQKDFDLDADTIPDIGFEIIDLHLFNPNGLPESLDSLAARVIPKSLDILDNSTYGYPDALDMGEQISDEGNWSNRTSVLGTFANAGQFQGQGEKYLAIRLLHDDAFKYGWIKVYCSQHNDTLKIIEYAYNDNINGTIHAGQKE